MPHPRTGDVYTTGGLDRETADHYSLNVTATDPGVLVGPRVSRATLHVYIDDVNDNRPQFLYESWVFSVTENGPVNVTVGVVTATDPDLGAAGLVSYTVLGTGEHYSKSSCS